ncbi:MAG: hypothetical protein R2708_23825 [Vicinamibacterales bacterium]
MRVEAVVRPEFEGGIEMVRRALARCERGDDEIDRVAQALRRALYDPAAPPGPDRQRAARPARRARARRPPSRAPP